MGLKDLFSKGPSRHRRTRDDDQYYYAPHDTLGRRSGGITAYQAATSAVSSRPYTKANSLRDSSSAAASALRKSYYGKLGYKDNVPRRTMSMTSGSIRQRPVSASTGRYPIYGNRTMSLQSPIDPYVRRRAITSSRMSSRANSLRSQTSRQSVGSASSVNTTTTTTTTTKKTVDSDGRPQTTVTKTTKLLDASGNARSIKKTTVERRGGLEIVRTTVIKPVSMVAKADAYSGSSLNSKQEEELADIEEEFDEDFTEDTVNPSLQSPVQFPDKSDVIPEAPEKDSYDNEETNDVRKHTTLKNEIVRSNQTSHRADEVLDDSSRELQKRFVPSTPDQKQHEYRKLANPSIPLSPPEHMSPRRSILKNSSPSFESENENVKEHDEVRVKEPERVVVANRSTSVLDSPGDNNSLYEDAPEGSKVNSKQVKIPVGYIVPEEHGKSLTSGRVQPSAEEMYAKAYKLAQSMVYKRNRVPSLERHASLDNTLEETTKRNTMMNTGEHGSIRSISSYSIPKNRPVSTYVPNNRGLAAYSLRELPDSRKMRKWREKEVKLLAKEEKEQRKAYKAETEGGSSKITAPESITSAASTISENKSEGKHKKRNFKLFGFGKKKHESQDIQTRVDQDVAKSSEPQANLQSEVPAIVNGVDNVVASKNKTETEISNRKGISNSLIPDVRHTENVMPTGKSVHEIIPKKNESCAITLKKPKAESSEIPVIQMPSITQLEGDKSIKTKLVEEPQGGNDSEHLNQRIESEDSERTIAADSNTLHQIPKIKGSFANKAKAVNGEKVSPSNNPGNSPSASPEPHPIERVTNNNSRNSKVNGRKNKNKKNSFGKKFMRFFDL